MSFLEGAYVLIVILLHVAGTRQDPCSRSIFHKCVYVNVIIAATTGPRYRTPLLYEHVLTVMLFPVPGTYIPATFSLVGTCCDFVVRGTCPCSWFQVTRLLVCTCFNCDAVSSPWGISLLQLQPQRKTVFLISLKMSCFSSFSWPLLSVTRIRSPRFQYRAKPEPNINLLDCKTQNVFLITFQKQKPITIQSF